MIRRLLATTGCAAAALALVSLPATAQASITTADVSLSAYHQVLEVGPPGRKCAANYTPGTIGRASRCLAAGQVCQHAHAADYTKYGFRCSLVGKRYQLSKTGNPQHRTTPHSKPPVKPTPPSTHHY
jgi:hypothetical protein